MENGEKYFFKHEKDFFIKQYIKKILNMQASDSFSIISEHFTFYRPEYTENFRETYQVLKNLYFNFIESVHKKNIKDLIAVISDDLFEEFFAYIRLSMRSLLVKNQFLKRNIINVYRDDFAFEIIKNAIDDFINQVFD